MDSKVKIKKCGKYIISRIEKFESGSFGEVSLARKEGEEHKEKQKLYVIKIPKVTNNPKLSEKSFDNEIDILKELSEIEDNKFTSILYDWKKFNGEQSEGNKIDIEKLDKEDENIEFINSPYYVIDYFSRWNLLDYITSGEIDERLAKIIFKRIIESFKSLHNKGICHLDIKTDNILFDTNFWPVIIDFGFAQKFNNKEEKLVDPIGGAEKYQAPEMFKKKKINGEKADIFSLGVVLFNFVALKFGFENSKKDNQLYKLIIDENFDEYWKKINRENLSQDFKNLYQKMVHPNPSSRPSHDDILKDPWFNEVNQINEEQIKNELNGIYDKIKTKNQKLFEIDNYIEKEGLITRNIEDKKNIIFTDKNLKPTFIPKDRININPYIKINGTFSRVDFMQTLADAISSKFGENCLIKGSKESLSFEVTF